MLCSHFERFLGRERQNLTSVDHARVVSDGDNSFPVWTAHILLLRQFLIHVKGTAAAAGKSAQVTRLLVLRLVFHAFQVHFLHVLQLLRIDKTISGAVRPLTYLILRLDVPLRVLQEFINVLSKHLLKVCVVDAALLAALVVPRSSVLARCVAALRSRGDTIAALHESLDLWRWILVKALCCVVGELGNLGSDLRVISGLNSELL